MPLAVACCDADVVISFLGDGAVLRATSVLQTLYICSLMRQAFPCLATAQMCDARVQQVALQLATTLDFLELLVPQPKQTHSFWTAAVNNAFATLQALCLTPLFTLQRSTWDPDL
eukprot:gb/GFBE01077171.1/.p1 GENE.gb/GFBE01077171.1/~~gb/GFBE01077171.1/.p1  ORF type:complete len:115 (+),score=8.43 gb/GFBE01077171.1/:1-345(+)